MPDNPKENLVTLKVPAMDCQEEAHLIKKKLSGLKGILHLDTLLLSQEVKVRYDGSLIDLKEILGRIQETGFEATLLETWVPKEADWGRRRQLALTSLSGLFALAGLTLAFKGLPGEITIPIYLMAMLTGGPRIFYKGFQAAKGLSLDMNTLMGIAVIGAAAIGEWGEAATVIALFSLAQLLESYSLDRARNTLSSLMTLTPQEALVRRGKEEVVLPVNEIQMGDILIVRPSEKIPLDGTVVEGYSTVNQAPITGESTPVEKYVGCEVFAGTINREGVLEVRVTHLAKDTTLSRIIHLVEECQAQKAPYQSFVDRFARIYTPIVIGAAFLVATVPWAFLGADLIPWLYMGLVFLVISCPCALVIATPVSLLSGITCAAQHGVLIKGGVHLEEAGRLEAIAFDKTGTLTKGVPEVIDIMPLDSLPHDELLRVAASVEAHSEHHLAGAILRRARKEGLGLLEVTDYKTIPGKGAMARIQGIDYHIGNLKFFRELGISTAKAERLLYVLQSQGKTVMLIGCGDKLLGTITVADEVRPLSKPTLVALREKGIKKIVMLTGDNRGTAQAIAGKLGVEEYQAELSPEDKVEAVRHLTKNYGRTAMVGDGVNDAPALAAATIGIAMGTAGTDTALETADIALMTDDLTRIPFALGLSRQTLGVIKQNIIFAIGVKAVFLGLAAMGKATLWMAVGADMGASLLVIFNGLRLLRYSA
ncbi:MAG TPA: heavy metal translocating P-type ATPase [Candidatus Brocadiales bacterium]|nr:heavy metal translocating P-type ATPase [Candidatus Brocadiales bacterium]